MSLVSSFRTAAGARHATDVQHRQVCGQVGTQGVQGGYRVGMGGTGTGWYRAGTWPSLPDTSLAWPGLPTLA